MSQKHQRSPAPFVKPSPASEQKMKRKRPTKETKHISLPRSFIDYTKQVIVALTNLQSSLTHAQGGVTDLLRAYTQHTASILAGGGDVVENLQLPPHIAAHATAAVEAAQTAGTAVTAAIAAPEGKKKRKRAEGKKDKVKDPNAPKRPLTAAFLFHQHARPIVKKDLEAALEPGQKLEANAVNMEVNKRWNELPPEDKEVSLRPL
jgi:hypothetical protein